MLLLVGIAGSSVTSLLWRIIFAMAAANSSAICEGHLLEEAPSQIEVAMRPTKKQSKSARLGIWHVGSKYGGFRAYLKRSGSKRITGNVRSTRWAAVSELLDSGVGNRIQPAEKERLKRKFEFQPVIDDLAEQLGSSGSQPTSSRTQTVDFIHQIYGLFRDGKAMSPLFQKSSEAWKKHAAAIGAQ